MRNLKDSTYELFLYLHDTLGKEEELFCYSDDEEEMGIELPPPGGDESEYTPLLRQRLLEEYGQREGSLSGKARVQENLNNHIAKLEEFLHAIRAARLAHEPHRPMIRFIAWFLAAFEGIGMVLLLGVAYVEVKSWEKGGGIACYTASNSLPKSKMMLEILVAVVAGCILGLILGWNRCEIPLTVIGQALLPPLYGLRESFIAAIVAIIVGLMGGAVVIFRAKGKISKKVWSKGFHIAVVTTFLLSLTIFQVLGQNFNSYGMGLRAFRGADLYTAIWTVPLLLPTLRWLMAKCSRG
jgi:hypothetical protein